MIESAANAIFANIYHMHHEAARKIAREVIKALREPSGDVMQAGNRAWLDGGNERQIYEAMIDAALAE